MVQYKTFRLKHYIAFFLKKKSLQPAKLLFDPPYSKSKFQSCSTIGVWGVYPEVLRAHAQKCFRPKVLYGIITKEFGGKRELSSLLSIYTPPGGWGSTLAVNLTIKYPFFWRLTSKGARQKILFFWGQGKLRKNGTPPPLRENSAK